MTVRMDGQAQERGERRYRQGASQDGPPWRVGDVLQPVEGLTRRPEVVGQPGELCFLRAKAEVATMESVGAVATQSVVGVQWEKE